MENPTLFHRLGGAPGIQRLVDDIVTMHMELTGSQVAERILSAWWRSVEKFTKIFPKDYKRVLEAQSDAIERGVDVDEAVMAAARG